MSSYPRRRAAIACEVVKPMKSRLLTNRYAELENLDAMEQNQNADSARYSVSYCSNADGKEINHDCHYRPAPAAPPSKFLLLELALTDRLERDIGRILHKMDNIEHNTSFQNRFHPMAIVTPPDSDHGSPHNIGDNRRFPLQLGSFAPRPRVPEETNALAFRRDLVEAATSSDVCLPRDLHRAASLPYIFAEFFKHERESPKIPFEIHYVHALPPNDFHVVGSLPVVTEQEIDTYFIHGCREELILDCSNHISPKYIAGSHSWSRHRVNSSIQLGSRYRLLSTAGFFSSWHLAPWRKMTVRPSRI